VIRLRAEFDAQSKADREQHEAGGDDSRGPIVQAPAAVRAPL
jgi:hypothetical protein